MATDTENIKELSSDYVNSYFSQLNPIAARVAKTINETKTAYGVLWCTLNNSDQNEIINETLIKPEITLQYIDNFPTKKSSSYTSLDCSLSELNISELQRTENNKKYYNFDGRNLDTYAVQKVAQKLLKDDALAEAGYRDEHSAPFTYRTRSQINFHLFGDEMSQKINENNKYNTKSSNNLDKLIKQQQLIQKSKNTAIQKQKTAKEKDTLNIKTNTTLTTTINNMNNRYVKSTAPDIGFNYLQYTHNNIIEHEECEKSSLIQSPENGTAVSDEDEQDDYHIVGEQELEEVKLLDSHVSLKRGFEFLNNW